MSKQRHTFSPEFKQQAACLVLDQRYSHDFTLSVAAADCYFDGHAGYAYVDGFGGVSPIPEPTTYGMMLAGLGLLGFMARRRSKQV